MLNVILQLSLVSLKVIQLLGLQMQAIVFTLPAHHAFYCRTLILPLTYYCAHNVTHEYRFKVSEWIIMMLIQSFSVGLASSCSDRVLWLKMLFITLCHRLASSFNSKCKLCVSSASDAELSPVSVVGVCIAIITISVVLFIGCFILSRR